MEKIRNLESRLRELRESNLYRKDFDKLKGEILSKKEEKKPRKIKRTDLMKSFEWKSPFFFKLNIEKSKVNGWRYPEPISLREVQNIFASGNINQQWIRIPDSYSEFREQWRLEFFYDPFQDYSKDFNPFKERPATLKYSGPQENYNSSQILIEKDIRFETKDIKKHERHLINLHKKIHGLKDKRAERYTDDEIYKVKRLLKSGMNGIEIFKRLYPEHKDFQPMDDYVSNMGRKDFKSVDDYIESPLKRNLSDYQAWATYKKTLRLIERVKTRKD